MIMEKDTSFNVNSQKRPLGADGVWVEAVQWVMWRCGCEGQEVDVSMYRVSVLGKDRGSAGIHRRLSREDASGAGGGENYKNGQSA